MGSRRSERWRPTAIARSICPPPRPARGASTSVLPVRSGCATPVSLPAVEGPVDVSWFDDHYYGAPKQIIDFFAGDHLDLAGKRVADLGTGDGIIALGLHQLARPASTVGFDLGRVDERALVDAAPHTGAR